jgi:hypothetical protein
VQRQVFAGRAGEYQTQHGRLRRVGSHEIFAVPRESLG